MSKYKGGASPQLCISLPAPLDCAQPKYQFFKYSKSAFSSHDVRCGFCMIFMISSDCFPTVTNQCVSEMDNHLFDLKWELFYVS